MSIGAVSSCSGGSVPTAVSAGLRGQVQAETLAAALGSGGLLDESTSSSLAMLREASIELTDAGLAAMQQELLGQLLDVLA